jgi:hypothetical protein
MCAAKRVTKGDSKDGGKARESEARVAVADAGESSINRVLQVLLHAFNDAKWAKKPAREFAVELRACEAAGALTVDLRWLISRGYAEHLIELASGAAKRRRFRGSGGLRFEQRSCFVLTPSGVEFAEDRLYSASQQTADNAKPSWDAQTRELRYRGELVKRYPARASRQIEVLNNFQLENWAHCIADPLPYTEKGAKARLHGVIANMNRSQRVIRFSGDGTGAGICWGPVEPE